MAAIEVSSNSFQNIILIIIVFLCIAYLYYEIMKIKTQYSIIENHISELNVKLDRYMEESKIDIPDKNSKNIIYYDSENKDSSENKNITQNEYKIFDKMDENNKSNPNIKEVIYSNYQNREHNIYSSESQDDEIQDDEIQDDEIQDDDIQDDDIQDDDIQDDEIQGDEIQDGEIQEDKIQDDINYNSIEHRMKDFDDEDFSSTINNKDDIFQTDFLQNTETNIEYNDHNPDDKSAEIDDKSSENESIDKVSDNESTVDYNSMTVKELREVLLILNLPVSGNKETLINRIKNKQ